MTQTIMTRRNFAALTSAVGLLAVVGEASAQSGSTTPASTAGEDPFQILADDHRRVEQLLQQIESGSPQQREALLKQLQKELTGHAVAEENIIYPAMVRLGRERRDAKELYDEHGQVKLALFDLEMMSKDDRRWMERFSELRRSLTKHVQEEEKEDFPKLRQALDPQTLQLLGRRVQEEKQKIG
jgi:hemerythrin superfamily protein